MRDVLLMGLWSEGMTLYEDLETSGTLSEYGINVEGHNSCRQVSKSNASVYIYTYTHIDVFGYIFAYIYVYIWERQRERERERESEREHKLLTFHGTLQ